MKRPKFEYAYPLKWHRFLQFVLMPAAFFTFLYLMITIALELLGFRVSYFIPLFHTAGMNTNHFGDKIWWIIGALGFLFLQILLVFYAWYGSLRWQKYSRRLWLVHLLFLLVGYVLVFYAVYMNNYQNLIGSILYQLSGLYINPSVILALLTIFLAVLILFVILNLHYYHKRRKMYGIDYRLLKEKAALESTAEEPAGEAAALTETKSTTENIAE